MSASKARGSIKRWSGPALFILGAFAIVVGTVGPAAASATLSVSPDTGLTDGQSVTVSGSGFAASSPGGVLECNSDPGQPTILVAGSAAPVSCTSPFSALHSTDASGALAATTFTVHTGTVGPPGTGTDSAGHDAAADAALYPCPPTPAQLAAGDTCLIAFGDLAGDKATHTIHFTGEVAGTTTTTSASTTSTTHATTTSTTTHATTTSTTSAPTTTTTSHAGPSVAVAPATGLTDGATVSVSGAGYDPGLGVILECSSDKAQPTVSVSGNPVPVSCSNPFNALINFDAGGKLPATDFVVHEGTVGPPATGTDSAGHDAATDATLFPCPPTPAQVAAGDSCGVVLADIAGHQAIQPISFQSSGSTTTTAVGAVTTTTSASATTTTTTAKPGLTLLLGSSSPTPGQAVSLQGTGFPANTSLGITFASTPVSLGTVTSDKAGGFTTTVTIPNNAALGAHEIIVSTADGKTSISVPLTVVAAATNNTTASAAGTATTVAAQVLGTSTTNGQVAFTGLDAEEWILLGVFCMISGLLLIAHARIGPKRVVS